jgi:hypothetical protein
MTLVVTLKLMITYIEDTNKCVASSIQAHMRSACGNERRKENNYYVQVPPENHSVYLKHTTVKT